MSRTAPNHERAPRLDLRTRLYVEQPLAAGIGVELGAERCHYLRHVLRLAVGAPVALFNGDDGEWRAVIDSFGKEHCRLRIEARRRPPDLSRPDLWLLFAPIKRAGLELVVEKATELGVSRLVPVLTRHTDLGRLNLERLTAIATEAAGQCERLTVPEIAEPRPLARVLEAWPIGERPLLVCAESGTARPLAVAAAGLAPGPAAILVGPEGGFATSELDEIRNYPFVVGVGLGPRILRAETAAIAALAGWQAIRGDWSQISDGGDAAAALDVRPPFRDLRFAGRS